MFRTKMLVAVAAFSISANVPALSVYVMSSGNATNDTNITDLLSNAGHTVTLGLQWFQQDGAQGLSSFDSVVFLNNYNWSASPMSSAGQQEVLDYVTNGGGLVTSEWFVWNLGAGSRFSDLAPLSPVEPTNLFNSAAQTTYTQATANPIINSGMPNDFTFTLDNIGGTETRFIPRSGATVFYSSSNGGGLADSGGLVGWEYGGSGGRVISFSTVVGNTELGDPNYANLFVNSVEWAAPVPLPAALPLFGSALFGLAFLARRRA